LAEENGLAIEIELDQAVPGGGVGSGESGSNFWLVLLIGVSSFLGVWLVRK